MVVGFGMLYGFVSTRTTLPLTLMANGILQRSDFPATSLSGKHMKEVLWGAFLPASTVYFSMCVFLCGIIKGFVGHGEGGLFFLPFTSELLGNTTPDVI